MLKTFLSIAKRENASDIHLVQGCPLTLRTSGVLKRLKQEITKEIIFSILKSILSHEQLQQLQVKRDIDLSYESPNLPRARVNVYYQNGQPALAIRLISPLLDLRELNMPPVIESFSALQNGLVLVTGPTGSGKSTTLAAIIKRINETRAAHIITLENPIEYRHTNIKSLITQREIYSDAVSFPSGLRSALRQDPYVILIGEMRDAETISTALTAAETGHLVLSTLHTSSSKQAIDRIIDVFPAPQQSQVRLQLSTSLRAIISQQLIPTNGKYIYSQIAACEILINNDAVQNLIRESKTHQLQNIMQTSQSIGMKTLGMSIAELLNSGIISYSTAAQRIRPDEFKNYLRIRS